MNSQRYSLRRRLAILCVLPLLLTASALVANPSQDSESIDVTTAAARAAIEAQYDAWGRARVELDKETMDSILAPDFYVLLYGKKISRGKFIGDISQEREGSSLTRFDADVLTVRKSETGWTAVITEKLELAILGSGGETQKVCSLWVTRDGWRREGDEWLVTFSEAIGHEYWEPGAAPPIPHWAGQ